MFQFKKNKSDLILRIYVNDGLLVGSNEEEINKVLLKLAKEFKIKISKERNTKTYVKLEIKNNKNLILNQKNYIKRILQQSKIENAKTVKVPLLRKDNNKTHNLKTKNYPYREMVVYSTLRLEQDLILLMK